MQGWHMEWRTPPQIGPLTWILVTVVLGLAFLLGFVVFGALLALGAVALLVRTVRQWLTGGTGKTPRVAPGDSGQVIEGDYEVLGESSSAPGKKLPH